MGTVKDGVSGSGSPGLLYSPTRGYVLSTYDASEIDLLAVYAGASIPASRSQ